MATWEDGPEYAPHDPPVDFSAPTADPLSQASPRASLSAGAPALPPRDFAAPTAAPLATIGTGLNRRQRNPQEPFAVNAGALTEGTSAWSAAHSMHNAEPAPQQWAPPNGAPVVATAPTAPPAGRDPLRPIAVAGSIGTSSSTSAPLAPPGASSTPQWAPPPSGAVGEGASASDLPVWRRVLDLLTWPLVASLALGLIPPISPVMLVVSTVLAWRLDDTMRSVRIAITAGLGYTMLIALLALLGSQWWNTTSTWAWAVTIFASLYAVVMGYLVTTGKIRNAPPPPNSP